jgi:hypothetical protein
MSITPVAPTRDGSRRVRHQAREAAAVMAFSAGTSVLLAAALLLLTSLGR